MKCHERLGLPGPADAAYWEKIRVRADELGSDGCSGPALQIHVLGCYEHDVHYRTGLTLYGRLLTRREADAIFFERMQEFSFLNGFSPLSWWRWLVLRAFGAGAWQGAR